VLRRASIQSPNFVTNSAGWTINQDGSAEFNNIKIRNGQIVSGVALYYSAAPAFGNLVASISAAAGFGTDSFGNVYIGGIAAYLSSGGLVTSFVLNGGLAVYTAATMAGPWTLQDTWSVDASGNLSLNMGSVLGQFVAEFTQGGSTLLTANATVTGGPLLGLSWPNPTGPMMTLTNAINSSTAALILASALVAANTAFAAQQVGDTQNRLKIACDGTMKWGSGSAVQDAFLARISAALLGVTSCDFTVHTVGRGLRVAEGLNAKQGTATMNGGTPSQAVVATTALTASSRVFYDNNLLSGTGGVVPSYAIVANTPGTGFTLQSSVNGDTSAMAWEIYEPG
jgi:hypothetical protein